MKTDKSILIRKLSCLHRSLVEATIELTLLGKTTIIYDLYSHKCRKVHMVTCEWFIYVVSRMCD